MEEVQGLKSENYKKELTYKIEIDKLHGQIELMKNNENERIEKGMKVRFEDSKLKGVSPKKSPSKSPKHANRSPKNPMKTNASASKSKFDKLELKETSSQQAMSALVGTGVGGPSVSDLNLREKIEEHKNQEEPFHLEENEIKGDGYDNILVNESEHSSSFIDTDQQELGDNPYASTLIAELKSQINYLETTVNEKEDMLKTIKAEFEKSVIDSAKNIGDLQKNLDSWQQEYNKQLVRNKTLYDEFSQWMDKKERALKSSYTESVFDLEKKILHLEKVNTNLTIEMDKINEMNQVYTKECELRVKRYSDQNNKLLLKYEELWKTYEVDLAGLTEMVFILIIYFR